MDFLPIEPLEAGFAAYLTWGDYLPRPFLSEWKQGGMKTLEILAWVGRQKNADGLRF